jgi:hypothetical protein
LSRIDLLHHLAERPLAAQAFREALAVACFLGGNLAMARQAARIQRAVLERGADRAPRLALMPAVGEATV